MVQLLTAYYVAFALSCWPSVAHHPRQDPKLDTCGESAA